MELDVRHIGSVDFRLEPRINSLYPNKTDVNRRSKASEPRGYLISPGGPTFEDFMAEVHPITGETPLRRYASRRRTPTPGGVEPVSRDKMAAPTSFQKGYDPYGMAWTTVTTSEAQNSAVPKFRHESLNEAVARRSLVQSKATMTSGPPAFKRQPPASRAAGSKGKALTNWKPCPFPKPGPDDFVVVVKPREHMWRHQAFSENRYGAAFTAYLGPEVARSVTVMPSREQNLIVIHTQNPAAADRLLGEFSINTESEAIPLYEYLRQDGGDVCHGVIAVSNTDSNTETESLRQQVQWGAGTIVEVRKFGSSNRREKPRFVHYENMLITVQNY
ncbi:hypothetical protein HPB49_025981 [Dermacentor silvarum]|nr:hypothetical protein HPB49_025981 [Dermacentor silvarum]